MSAPLAAGFLSVQLFEHGFDQAHVVSGFVGFQLVAHQ
jgi:hypothetical protein